eukprot:scaffold15965_cov15-Phaeocystis_antarctica.AAC.1
MVEVVMERGAAAMATEGPVAVGLATEAEATVKAAAVRAMVVAARAMAAAVRAMGGSVAPRT